MVKHDAAFTARPEHTVDFACRSLGIRGVMEDAPGIHQVKSLVRKWQQLCVAAEERRQGSIAFCVLPGKLERDGREVQPHGCRPCLRESKQIGSHADANFQYSPASTVLEPCKRLNLGLSLIANPHIGWENFRGRYALWRLERSARPCVPIFLDP